MIESALLYKQLIELVSEEMQLVDQVISEKLFSNIKLIDQISKHIISSGGKRLRPILLLLMANALGCNALYRHEMAAVIEFVHTATLLHDDVVDKADMRRGVKTANAQFGNDAAVLVGDFLYTRAFQMMVDVGSMEVMSLIADTVNIISEGEVLQLVSVRDKTMNEARYLQIIHSKTAQLFEAAAQTAAILAGASIFFQRKAAEFGRYLGIAFQLKDDWFDYSNHDQSLGKRTGSDFREGKLTLPLILLAQSDKFKYRQLIRNIFDETDKIDLFGEICFALRSSGALDETLLRAERSAKYAVHILSDFPDSPYKAALITLCKYAILREK